jgi:Flp pilus assembly pilin Flp
VPLLSSFQRWNTEKGEEMKMLSRLWADEAGFVVSSELVLIATLAVIGLIAGLQTVRDQVLQELADTANAVSNVNQSYSFSGVTGHSSSTAGSIFVDQLDQCDDQTNGGTSNEPHCIDVVGIAPTPEA